MTTPAAVNQRAQYATESVPGTAVTANRAFRATTVTMGPTVEVETVRPSGSRFASTTYIKKEMSEGKFEGLPCFNETPRLLSWAFGAPVNEEGTGGEYTHTWLIGAGQTRTIELGDSTAGAKVAGCFVKNLTFEWGRNSGDAKVSGDIVGGQWTDGVTMATSITASDVLPMEAHKVSVFVDDSYANLGETQMADALKVTFTTGDIRDAVWTLNSSKPSFSDRVDIPLDGAEVELMVKSTTEGRAFLAGLRSGNTYYLRIQVTGEDASMNIDLAVRATEHSRDEQDGIWASTTKLRVVEDSSAFSHKFQVTDTTATW